MCPPAKTMTISPAPIASGASAPAPVSSVAMPTVNRNRNVPMNSTAIFLLSGWFIRCFSTASFGLLARWTRWYRFVRRRSSMRRWTMLLVVLAALVAATAQADARPWKAEPAWISNAGVYRQHEFVYQDYLYDDHGSNTNGLDRTDAPFGAAGPDLQTPTDPRMSPAPLISWAGDFTYASDDNSHIDNVADLTEFRVAADKDAVSYRIRMGDMTAPDSSVVGICVDEDNNRSTGVQSWPDGANFTAALGCDHLYTVYGKGADVSTPAGTTDLAKLGGTVTADAQQGYIELSVPRSVANPGTGTWRYWVASGIWDAAK